MILNEFGDCMSWYGGFRPYVRVADRRKNAEKEVKKLKKKGEACYPVILAGRTIASTFWGKAWCDHLESYSDYENRLPRGRTYVRNGSVIDLKMAPGEVTALVSGSSLYKVKITIKKTPSNKWIQIVKDCSGQIDSLIELIQGQLSKGVMKVVTDPDKGLFPNPKEIELSCSCPDWADMCKHVAATLYGVGARLDQSPEELFTLRQVDHRELIAKAGTAPLTQKSPSKRKKILADTDLSSLFGIDMGDTSGKELKPVTKKSKVKKKTAAKKSTPKVTVKLTARTTKKKAKVTQKATVRTTKKKAKVTQKATARITKKKITKKK
jgi:uncharacterized Zn finger protein